MACVADITRIAAAVSGECRGAQHPLRLNGARSLHHAVIEILVLSPTVSLLMSILTTLIACLPRNDEIEACVEFDHPNDISVVQLAEIIAVIESAIVKVSPALVSIEGALPRVSASPFRFCIIATIAAGRSCLLEFQCSASLYF